MWSHVAMGFSSASLYRWTGSHVQVVKAHAGRDCCAAPLHAWLALANWDACKASSSELFITIRSPAILPQRCNCAVPGTTQQAALNLHSKDMYGRAFLFICLFIFRENDGEIIVTFFRKKCSQRCNKHFTWKFNKEDL